MSKIYQVVFIVVAIASIAPHPAVAEPPAVEVSASAPRRARHSVYVEALGKGGLWGLGYSYEFRRRFALGVVGSFSVIDHERITSLSPFVTAYLVGRDRHRWFVDAGPQVVHVSTPSPVPEWSGTSATGLGAQLATGYQYRNHVVLRAFVMGVVGKGGVAPWLGADLGWSL